MREKQPDESEKIMKKAPASKSAAATTDQLRDEYHFDYAKAKPNRFASRAVHAQLVVALDEDVSSIFSTPEAVNKALRAFIQAMPRQSPPKKAVTRTRRKKGA